VIQGLNICTWTLCRPGVSAANPGLNDYFFSVTSCDFSVASEGDGGLDGRAALVCGTRLRPGGSGAGKMDGCSIPGSQAFRITGEPGKTWRRALDLAGMMLKQLDKSFAEQP